MYLYNTSPNVTGHIEKMNNNILPIKALHIKGEKVEGNKENGVLTTRRKMYTREKNSNIQEVRNGQFLSSSIVSSCMMMMMMMDEWRSRWRKTDGRDEY